MRTPAFFGRERGVENRFAHSREDDGDFGHSVGPFEVSPSPEILRRKTVKPSADNSHVEFAEWRALAFVRSAAPQRAPQTLDVAGECRVADKQSPSAAAGMDHRRVILAAEEPRDLRRTLPA